MLLLLLFLQLLHILHHPFCHNSKGFHFYMFYSSFYSLQNLVPPGNSGSFFFFWGSLAVMDRHMLPSLPVNFWCRSGFYRIWPRWSLWKHMTMWKLWQHARRRLIATRLGPWTGGNGYSSEQEWSLQGFCPVKQCCHVHQRHSHQSTVLGNSHKTRCFRRLSHCLEDNEDNFWRLSICLLLSSHKKIFGTTEFIWTWC